MSSQSTDLTAFLRQLHSDFGSQVSDADFVFFNYGLMDTGKNHSEDRPYRHQLDLIRTLIDSIDLNGGTVIEAGSGRGGNCDYLRRYTPARNIYGIDPCASYVDFSRRAFPDDRLVFMQGEAEAMPFRDLSADCVLSIQSAHCYSDFDGFLTEAHRVLKPGGTLGIADIWDLELFPLDWRARERQLKDCGMTLCMQRDITAEVSAALESGDGFTASLAQARTASNAPLVDWMVDGLGKIRSLLADRRCSYRAYALRKPSLRS